MGIVYSDTSASTPIDPSLVSDVYPVLLVVGAADVAQAEGWLEWSISQFTFK